MTLLARQCPQQAAGGGEQVDGGGAISDEGGLYTERLEQFGLRDRQKTDGLHVPSHCCFINCFI